MGQTEGRATRGLLRTLMLLLLLSIGLLAGCEKEYDPKNAGQAGTSLEQIASALDKYAVDHDGCFPTDFTDILGGDYMRKLPFNGYQKAVPLLGVPRVKQLKPGQPPTNGDFVYVPGPTASKPGTCKDYRLYLYGDPRDVNLEEKIESADGVKMDHVILLIVGERGHSVPGKSI